MFKLISSIILIAIHSFIVKASKYDTRLIDTTLSKIQIKDKWFIDENKRVVLFHGINAVQKEFPWIPNQKEINLTNKTQLFNLKKWGFNVVRLGLMWAGLMPEKNKINQTYLDEMTKIVDNLEANGLYVIIDLHQDMMSSKFASYDGVPRWVIDELPTSKFEFPWPLKNQTLSLSVFAAYITEPCGHAFQCLYDNVNNFADYFQDYWTIITKHFSTRSSILGYELLNEPWAGNVYANPLLILPGVAGGRNLLKLYDRTYETIRKIDKKTLIFYEPVTWGVMLNRNYFGTGFKRPPGNDSSSTVFSWHYYCWFLNFKENPLINGTYPKFDKLLCDNVQLKISFEAVKYDMLELGGGPSFLTEFGVCAFGVNDEINSLMNVDECKAVLDEADKNFQSWTYWDSRFYGFDTLEEIPELVDAFARVYPQATNGIPVNYFFNSTSREFTFTFQMNITSYDQALIPTIIHIPPDTYPLGFYCKISPFLRWYYDKENFRILIFLTDENLKMFKISNDYFYDEIVKVRIMSIIDLV